MTKKELAAKIAKAQNLSESKLMKMTLGELEDMDRAFSDEDGGDLLGADSAPSEGDHPEIPESDEGAASDDSRPSDVSEDTQPDAPSESEPVEGKVIGYHPVTGKPVVE
jgi:hypothetical protein